MTQQPAAIDHTKNPGAEESRRMRFNDESKLCFWAAMGCLVVGTIGWLVNYIAPGSTMLGALLLVGCFYLFLGLTSLLHKNTGEREAQEQVVSVVVLRGHAAIRNGPAETRLEKETGGIVPPSENRERMKMNHENPSPIDDASVRIKNDVLASIVAGKESYCDRVRHPARRG